MQQSAKVEALHNDEKIIQPFPLKSATTDNAVFRAEIIATWFQTVLLIFPLKMSQDHFSHQTFTK